MKNQIIEESQKISGLTQTQYIIRTLEWKSPNKLLIGVHNEGHRNLLMCVINSHNFIAVKSGNKNHMLFHSKCTKENLPQYRSSYSTTDSKVFFLIEGVDIQNVLKFYKDDLFISDKTFKDSMNCRPSYTVEKNPNPYTVTMFKETDTDTNSKTHNYLQKLIK